MKKLVIVESPTKAKKLKGWLPREYVVASSVGHIRDLPPNDRKVPEKYKGREGLRHGIIIDDGFEPIYVPSERGKKVIAELKEKLKTADELYLATDPDREGESISWHLKEALAPKVPVRRVTFNEVTKKAVEAAFANPREIDGPLVNAQETRRILDRLVGYELSPLLWTKIATGLSAGRVQSVAVRLIVERERARMRFQTSSYWDLRAALEKDETAFEALLVTLAGKEVVSGKKYFDEETGAFLAAPNVVLLDEKAAKALVARLEGKRWTVASVDEQSRTSKPYEPFITDTLVGAANSRLGLSARESMRIAQRLYEEGFITYHRTDSPALGDEGLAGARTAAAEAFGKEFLSPEPRIYSPKASASAQEAHEAIRPAGESFVRPEKSGLSGRELDVYRMVWQRTVASQMKDERFTSTTVLFDVEDATFKSTGKRVDFPGWRKAYGYDEESETLLPALAKGDTPACKSLEAVGHETKPPARYTEGSLIKALKEDGVGRPSTYAQIMETIQDKGYANADGRALVPTFTAFAVTQLLERHFPDLVDEQFTARMEETLDQIAAGDADWQPYLQEFYGGKTGLQAMVEDHRGKIDPREASRVPLPQLDGSDIIVRVGRWGPYIERQGADGQPVRANIPPDLSPADFDLEAAQRLLQQAEEGPRSIGTDPETGLAIYVLEGRFGPYYQLGEAEGDEKPKRASLPPGTAFEDANLEEALFMLSLPRKLGEHPEGGRVVANLGRYGPYVAHEKPDAPKPEYRSLKAEDDLKSVTLARALELLAEPKGRGRRTATVLAELGEHPELGGPVQVLDGRYGPYVKHAKVNATIPKGTDPKKVTIEDAVKLIAERAAKAPAKRKSARRKKKSG